MLANDAFLQALENSRLLTAEQLASVREAVGQEKGPGSAPQIADWLVAREWITPWQAKMLLAGKTAFFLGKYKLLAMLGQGGMGAVFKAEQQPLGRIVALKVMSERLLAEKNSVARFHREIQAAAALSHPNIVAAYDADHVGHTHFLVMEYVDGRTLEEVVRQQGRLPIGESCEYIRQAALGLAHAHEQGMTHRDIKPGNLLLTHTPEGPVVKLMDMGLARVVSETQDEGALTQTGQVLGTPDYIAPEQARNTHAADIRSDIFSLGCSLFRLISGGVPYGGTTVMAKLMARAMQPAQRLRAVRPDVPPALDALVAKMLALNPAERYQTPLEVVQALTPFSRIGATCAADATVAIEGGAVHSPTMQLELAELTPAKQGDSSLEQFLQQLQTTTASDSTQVGAEADTAGVGIQTAPIHLVSAGGRSSERLPSPRSRGAVLAIGIATLGLIVVTSVVVWAVSGATIIELNWPEDQRSTVTLEIDGRRVAVPAKGPLQFRGSPGRQSVKATRRGYEPLEFAWTSGRGERKTLDLPWKPTPETQRQLTFRDLEAAIGRAAVLKPSDPQVDETWARSLAFLRDAPGTPERNRLASLISKLPAPADAHHAADIPRETAVMATGGRPKTLPSEVVAVLGDSRYRHPYATTCAALSPVGRFLATGGNEDVVRLWNLQRGNPARAIPGMGQRTVQLQFSKDGTRLYALGPYVLRVFSLPMGEVLQSIDTLDPERSNIVVAISPDEKQVAIGNDNAFLWLYEEDRPRELELHQGQLMCLAFTPDGSRLVSVAFAPQEPDKPPEYEVVTWTLSDLKPKAFRIPNTGAVALSPDARLLAVRNFQSAVVYDVASEQKRQEITLGDDPQNLAFSPDGSLLAAQGLFTSVWNTQTFEIVKSFSQWADHIAFTPDGHSLLLASDAHRVRQLALNGRELLVAEPSITSAVVDPDGKSVWLGTSESHLRQVELATLKELRRINELSGVVGPLAVSPDGKQLIASALADHGHVTIHAIALDRDDRKDINPNTSYAMAVSYRLDGSQFALGTFGGGIHVFDAESLEQKYFVSTSLPDVRMEPFCVAWSSDGTRLAAGAWLQDESLRIWDTRYKSKLAGWRAHEGHVRGVAFSADGKELFTAGDDGSVRAWNVETHQLRSTLVFHPTALLSLRLSPDGTRLAAAAWDGSLIITTLPEGEPTRTIRFPHTGGLLAAEWTPDGRHVVTVNADGTAYLVRLEERGK